MTSGLTLRSADPALKPLYVGRLGEQLNNQGGSVADKKLPKLGSGERFKALQGELAKKGAKNPKALAAAIGRKKFGPAKMTKMAQAGKSKKG